MLTETEHDILKFERQWWRYAASKEDAIRVQFNMTPINYYQKLNTLLDKPEALAEDLALVRRLRRIADSRSRAHRNFTKKK